MSNKRLFQVLDEMNVNDEANKTETCACCFDLVGANKVKVGGHVTMGVPTEAVLKILLGEYQPMLVLLDKKVYHRLKDQPQDFEAEKVKLNRMLKSAVDTGKKAIERAERYEKALQQIEQMSDPGDHWKAICDMKAIASEALKPKTSSDDKENNKK